MKECGTLPSGHIATVRNTCCISVLAVDKVTKSVSLLWRQLRLPHDSICIIPLSNPSLCGSIALVSMNAVLLVSQETVIGTATCGFASTTVSSHIKLQPSKLLDGLELDASRWIESDNTTLVGSLKDGRLISIHLLFQSESLLQEVKFEVDLVAHSIQSSCFCKSETSNFWFLGSRLSDCLLIEAIMEYSEKNLPHVMTIDASQNSANITPALKRLRRGSDSSYISVVDTPGSFTRADRLADIISEEQDLYGSPLVPKQSVPYIGSGIGPGSSSKNMSLLGNGTSQLLNGFSTDHSSSLKYALRVVDTISVLGPVLDGTFCANDDTMDQMDRIEWNRVGMPLKKVVPNPASAYIVDREAKDSLHLYTGLDNQSGVHRITRGVRVSKLASRSFPGAISVHCLAASEAYSLLFVDFVDRSRVFQCTAANVKSFDNDKDLGSMILSSDLAVKEISCSDAGFISTAPTITVGIVHENVSVQVVSTCVRVVNMSKENGLNGEALQDVFVADDIEMGGLGGVVGEVIVRADICESWVALLTSIGSVYLLEFQESDEMLILKYSARCSGSKNDKEEDGKELSSDKPEECSSAQEGNTMPSYDNLLSLNPVTISLFYGHFPTLSETIKSKKVGSKVPSTPSSFSSASSSSASSSSASSSADVYVTPAQTLKSRNTSSYPSLSLLLPDNPDSQKKKEKTISLLEKQQLEEEIFLYGAHMDDVRSNRTTDLDVQHNFRECNNFFQDSKMDFDDETHSASETKYVETGVNDFSSSKCKVNFIDGDSEQKTSNCGEISAESKAENGIYQTPGKEEDKETKKSKETEEKEEEECSQDPMDIDDAEMMYLEDPERMYLVLSDYNGIVIVMSLCTLRTVFVTEEICLLPRFIKLSSTSTSHNNNDNDNDNKINNDNVIDKHDNDILTSRVSNSVRNNLTESNEHPVTPGIGPVSSRIPTPFAATPLNESNERAHTSRTQHRKVTDRVLIDARFARIGREDSPFGLSKLCLIIVLESSDVIVYYLVEKGTENIPRKSDTSSEKRKIAKANESENGIENDNENEKIIHRNESYFVKLEHSVVTRKKRNRIRKKGFHLNNINNSEIHSLNEIANGNSNVKSSSNINDKNRLDNGNVLQDSIASPLPQSLPLSSLPLSSLSSSSLPSSSSYYIDEDTDSRRIQISYNSNGRSSVLISGSRPITIINDSGLPFLAPLGLPELPFSNSGSYFVVPLKVGSVKGIASLWIENDDIEGAQGFSGVNGLLGINNDIKKPSVLQLYQEIPNQIIFPGSVTSSKKLHSGLTTHHCIELLAKSEDSTEQALLKRKTFILSCSTEKHVPFLSTVLTNDEKEKEETFYDRFFPSLDSFCQPDVTLAPAPLILYREHKLVIMQSGTAVDEFIFPLGEQILGVEALYLNVTTTTIIPAVLNIGNTITMEKKVKRVFLVACTSVEDKHGEDTQGEGRIMLFGLDYALFQDAVVDNSDGKDIDLVDHIEDPTSTSTAIPVSTVPGILGQINLPTPVLTLPVPKSKSQQSLEQSKFFKAIQPKLKLLWTGPGPASIVKQVGEFILSTVGTTVYIYRLNSDTMELEQITFYFAQVTFKINFEFYTINLSVLTIFDIFLLLYFFLLNIFIHFFLSIFIYLTGHTYSFTHYSIF